MLKQHQGATLFLNNVVPFENPYLTCDNSPEPVEGPLDCLLYSYEECRPRMVVSRAFERNHDTFIGRSEARVDVLILRDPFNLFASRLKRNVPDFKSGFFALPDLWILYAREYLGLTQVLNNNKVVINYNRWCADPAYRHQVALRLGLDFTDAGFEEVPPFGGGSSFDGLDYRAEASRMQVLNRFHSMVDREDFLNMFRDPLIVRLSDQIFGRFGETDSFVEERLKDRFRKPGFVPRYRWDALPLPFEAIDSRVLKIFGACVKILRRGLPGPVYDWAKSWWHRWLAVWDG
jgi:hypothetical protein